MSHPKHGDREERTYEERTDTAPTAHGPEGANADDDVVSDPALDDRVGSDWADEGGAVPAGPATATRDDRAEEAAGAEQA